MHTQKITVVRASFKEVMQQWKNLRKEKTQRVKCGATFHLQGSRAGKQGQFWIVLPLRYGMFPVRSGVFFSFDQAMETIAWLLAYRIISEWQAEHLRRAASVLELSVASHPFAADITQNGVLVLEQVYRDSRAEAMRDWPPALLALGS